MPVRVQLEDFDLTGEVARLRAAQGERAAQIGGITTFIGTVRDINDGSGVSSLTLEHYPGMTERALEDIVVQAKSRWDIFDALVIHRVGTLQPQDQIVLVVTLGAHRGEAFAACEFIMDYLKTQAPFWKKEVTPGGERWVEAKTSDDDAVAKWGAALPGGANLTTKDGI